MSTLLTLLIAALGLLDGQSFQVKVGESGKKLDTPHTLLFEKGTMRSPECSEWGFGSGRYTAKKEGKAITFEAVLPSKKEGKMTWRGTLTNGAVEGESVWEKAGQAPIRYRFEGHLLK